MTVADAILAAVSPTEDPDAAPLSPLALIGYYTTSSTEAADVPIGPIPDDTPYATHPMETCIIYTAILLLPLYCVAAAEAYTSYFSRRYSNGSDSPPNELRMPDSEHELPASEIAEFLSAPRDSNQDQAMVSPDTCTPCVVKQSTVETLTSYSNLGLWMGLMTSLYILDYNLCRTDTFGAEHRTKNMWQHRASTQKMYLNLFIVYLFGNTVHHFQTRVTKYKLVLCVLYFNVGFVITHETCKSIALTSKGGENYNSNEMELAVVFALSFPMVIYGVCKNVYSWLYHARPRQEKRLYATIALTWFSGTVLIMILCFAQGVSFHSHHRDWSLVLAALCRSNDSFSKIAQCLLIAIHVQSYLHYG